MTMRHIKAVCSKSNKRQFIIVCVMDDYEESNATIQARHPKLSKEDTYEFEASKDLLMCMPFDFIDGLKDKNGLILTKNGGQVDEASEESSIKQHQTDQIYKANWKT
jgi:hypothetical protein